MVIKHSDKCICREVSEVAYERKWKNLGWTPVETTEEVETTEPKNTRKRGKQNDTTESV